jgi:integral membrane protein (TIGR03766 family)
MHVGGKNTSKIDVYAVIHWVFYIAAGLLFINAIFFNRNTPFIFLLREQALNFIAVLAVFCLLSCLAFYLYKRKTVDAFLQKNNLFIVYGVMLAVFILQLIYTSLIHSSLEHDVQLIIHNAQARTPDEFIWIEYFSLYPNNFMLLFFFRFVHGLASLFNMGGGFSRILVVVNILFVNTAIALTFHTVKNVFNVYSAYVAWIFLLLLTAFSPHLIVPYSDTLSMPFAIGIVFLYTKLIKSTGGRRFTYAAAVGVTAQIGYLIKPSAVIPLIAVCIIQVVLDLRLLRQSRRRSKNTYLSMHLAVAVMVMLLTGGLFNSFVRIQNTIPFVEGVAFPPEHWIKMGMQRQDVGDRYSYGAYNAEDFFFTASFLTTEEKRRADRGVIRERLSDFGLTGYAGFLINKARWITGDGTFHWGEFAFKNLEGATGSELRFKNLFFPGGTHYTYFAHFAQGIWLFVLLWYFVYAFQKKDTSNPFVNICIFTVMGLVAFILLTEGRSRYLINHLPYLAILSSFCFKSTFHKAYHYLIKK